MFPIPFKILLFQQCEGSGHKEQITQLLIMVCESMCVCVCEYEKVKKQTHEETKRGKDVCGNRN